MKRTKRYERTRLPSALTQAVHLDRSERIDNFLTTKHMTHAQNATRSIHKTVKSCH
jgi:hypothetical protein